ncbi:MAG TPA: TspO/MBR family protein [Longimicrobium sp.]|nr:TspO/MBR family protein [Longimicrobium sp.]
MSGPVAGWAIAAAWCVAVLGAGGALTRPVLGGWYRALRKPWFQPPDWLFGPAWTVILACAAAAFAHAWSASPDADGRAALLGAWLLNGALNVAWSWLFFTRRRPDQALAEVVPLWISIVPMALLAGAAGWLLLPYLAWVSFAAVLNAAVVRLNRPFPAH